jgi:hypothetical protein
VISVTPSGPDVINNVLLYMYTVSI